MSNEYNPWTAISPAFPLPRVLILTSRLDQAINYLWHYHVWDSTGQIIDTFQYFPPSLEKSYDYSTRDELRALCSLTTSLRIACRLFHMSEHYGQGNVISLLCNVRLLSVLTLVVGIVTTLRSLVLCFWAPRNRKGDWHRSPVARLRLAMLLLSLK